MLLAGQTCTEMIQSFLGDDSCVSWWGLRSEIERDIEFSMERTEPPSVRLHTSRFCLVLSLLKRSSLNDPSVGIAYRLPPIEHLQTAYLFGIAVEVLALDLF